MASSDDDDDLRRAIALSLEDDTLKKGPTIDLTTDSDDEDLRRAIALSLDESHQRKRDNAKSMASVTALEANTADSHPARYDSTVTPGGEERAQHPTDTSAATASKPFSLLGLDRKAMEQERLARLGKRKRTPSAERPAKRVETSNFRPGTSQADPTDVPYLPSTKYPRGVIKRTWAFKHPRVNDIKIEEIFQAASANVAIISSWQWDSDWVFDKLNPSKTKQIWIMNVKSEEQRKKQLDEIKEAGIPNFKSHFPPMGDQINIMHSKLMLIFHNDYLRIVVPTGNMVKEDWGETNTWQPGVMENLVFLIDLPRRPNGEIAKEAETEFGKELISFLKAQEVSQNVVEGVLKFDLSSTNGLAFVHSIGGSHSSPAYDRTGLPGLANAIRNLKLDAVEKLELDYAASSLGALKEPFLKQIYLAASGLSPLSETKSDILSHFRIYFPTRETVINSTGGPACGGTITFARSYFNNPSFPRKCLRDYKSVRPGVLSHNKILLARGLKKDGTAFAWTYVGSSNISESAWGSQKVLRNGKEGSLNIRNWECGVVVPVPEEKMRDCKLEQGEVPPMKVFEGTVDVPFQYPGEKYDGKEPWFFKD